MRWGFALKELLSGSRLECIRENERCLSKNWQAAPLTPFMSDPMVGPHRLENVHEQSHLKLAEEAHLSHMEFQHLFDEVCRAAGSIHLPDSALQVLSGFSIPEFLKDKPDRFAKPGRVEAMP